jgi:hypothetical protein
LDLGVTKVTDAGVAHLEGLKQLRHLDLACQITDAALKHLRPLSELQTLNLSDTRVTDAGLEHLESLTKLRRVRLYFDKVSVEGIKKLQQALPNCKIESDYDKIAKPAELKVLGRLVGTWNTECTEKSGEREKRIGGVMSVEWMLDGWFVRCKGMRKPEKITNEQIIGFSAKKGFQMWYFDSWGLAMAAAGQWNETSKTLTWRATPADNVVLVNEEHFIDDDTTEWHMVASNRDGAVLFEQRGKMTRQK